MAHVLLGAYLLACLLALVWPVAEWTARVEPRVLGLPFAFAWQILWILLTCLAMALYHRAVSGKTARAERESA